MRQVTPDGLDFIKQFEGFSPRPYLCQAGINTIGHGHVITANDNFSSYISEGQATALLAEDVGVAERAVLRQIHRPLSDNQFDALVSFTFNLGGGALQASTLRRKCNRGDDRGTANEFKRWIYAGGKRSRGLLRRRLAEAEIYRL